MGRLVHRRILVSEMGATRMHGKWAYPHVLRASFLGILIQQPADRTAIDQRGMQSNSPRALLMTDDRPFSDRTCFNKLAFARPYCRIVCNSGEDVDRPLLAESRSTAIARLAAALGFCSQPAADPDAPRTGGGRRLLRRRGAPCDARP